MTQENFGKFKQEVLCPSCRSRFSLIEKGSYLAIKFCPYCMAPLDPNGEKFSPAPLKIPTGEHVEFTLGNYHVLKTIGSGGMGQVFLAYDTTCGRKIALKRIRTDLVKYKQIHNRFLREARITSQLTHPAIIPIYSIHYEDEFIYYTMPFVEGKTLKQILLHAYQLEKKGIKTDQIDSSIPSLIPTFLSICQAIAYSHSKNVLHRDIKPENIIVGTYGEVLILDWGLAKQLIPESTTNELEESLSEETEEPFSIDVGESSDSAESVELTSVGKVVGTVSYMAPERALGQPATQQTDIYALGVILYQILTLRLPFDRGSLKKFRENMHKEALFDPAEVAPYREVPPLLSGITLKSLTKNPKERYQTVDDLIYDLKNYLEGRSEWFQVAQLDINKKTDWEFQENVLLAEHVAITRATEVSDWVSLMISKTSFAENTKIEAKVRIGDWGHGIGFLLSIPETSERIHLNDGYCLWIGSNIHKSTKLLRATVEVIHAPEIHLQKNEWYQVRIEKIDHKIYFYINDVLQFSYISHIPLIGTHIGILSRDADFSIQDLFVSVGSQSIEVNCLAVPDAFLAHKDYDMALSEYRRIGYSFPGTAEGREALFRAGVTLLDQARNTPDKSILESLYSDVLSEFEKLRNTPGAPLEYLGKALTYLSIGDYEEEIKCFEIAYRRYPRHPLLPRLEEQIVYRMHDSSRNNRKATYNFILFTVWHLPKVCLTNNARKLFSSLKMHWEPLYFINNDPTLLKSDEQNFTFAIELAFWIARPYTLIEVLDKSAKKKHFHLTTVCNALFSLIELGAWQLAEEKLAEVSRQEDEDNDQIKLSFDLIRIAILCHKESLQMAYKAFIAREMNNVDIEILRTAIHLMEYGLMHHEYAIVHEIADQLLNSNNLSPENKLQVDCCRIRAFLWEGNWTTAGECLQNYSLDQLTNEDSLLHFLYGCWLCVTEGKEIAYIHYTSVLEVSYPRTWTLFSHFFERKSDKLKSWLQQAFLWEKRELYKQCSLFYRCLGDLEKTHYYKQMQAKEYLDVTE